MSTIPKYVEGHGLLKGKSVLITAAAGAGIGFSAAKRAAEEGCRAHPLMASPAACARHRAQAVLRPLSEG